MYILTHRRRALREDRVFRMAANAEEKAELRRQAPPPTLEDSPEYQKEQRRRQQQEQQRRLREQVR
jgi:hypothetical protein